VQKPMLAKSDVNSNMLDNSSDSIVDIDEYDAHAVIADAVIDNMDQSEYYQHKSNVDQFSGWRSKNNDSIHEAKNPATYGLIHGPVNVPIDSLTPLQAIPENLDHVNLSGNYALDSLGIRQSGNAGRYIQQSSDMIGKQLQELYSR
jgi:hypothetical protein